MLNCLRVVFCPAGQKTTRNKDKVPSHHGCRRRGSYEARTRARGGVEVDADGVAKDRVAAIDDIAGTFALLALVTYNQAYA